ncbi:hypothetical protein B0H13DRAFT_1876724 [Mycena leptocephala]|nr:hypothetical protein B0H13DRAFT_1876724 [Mycena leptocephala]
MKNPTGFSALPTELIHSIFGRLELKDLIVLCRTDHQIHAICLGWIYRSITLESPVQVLKCCKSVISRKEAADAVRELKIFGNPTYALKSFYRTFESAIKRMQTSRNPTITSISILPEDPSSDFNTSHIQPIHMPKLVCFDGPESAARSVVPGSVVSRVAIFWMDRPVMEFSRCLTAVAASKVDITELSNVVYSWNPGLLKSIATHMPRLQFLQIRNRKDLSVPIVQERLALLGIIFAPRSRLTQAFFSAFDDTLRCLPCLVGLIMVEGISLRPHGLSWLEAALESEFETVQRWGEISATLIKLTLPSTTHWARLFDNVWFPGNPSKDCPETVHCLKWLIKKVLTSPELPKEYRLLADGVGGAHEMAP